MSKPATGEFREEAGEAYGAPVMGRIYPLVPREHEPEFDVTEIHTFASREPFARLRRCAHANVLPVVSCGELVAHLCIDCDEQLPEWL